LCVDKCSGRRSPSSSPSSPPFIFVFIFALIFIFAPTFFVFTFTIMADILSPPSFASTYPNPPYPPQSKLFEPIPLSDKFAAPPYERPTTASGILRPIHTKNGDGPDLEKAMTQPTLQRYRRHREYYIDGGDIVFLVRPSVYSYDCKSSNCSPPIQVENVLFRVHRSVPSHKVSPVWLKVWRTTVISLSANLLYSASSSQGMGRESGQEAQMQTRVSLMV